MSGGHCRVVFAFFGGYPAQFVLPALALAGLALSECPGQTPARSPLAGVRHFVAVAPAATLPGVCCPGLADWIVTADPCIYYIQWILKGNRFFRFFHVDRVGVFRLIFPAPAV
jgi:hypothetical protein